MSKMSLSRVRSKLLKNNDIKGFIIDNKKNISSKDFLFSVFFFVGGIAIVSVASHLFSYTLLSIGIIVEIIGIIGFVSLSHESWHSRAVKNRLCNNVISKYFLAPLFLRDFEQSKASHISHHRYFGGEKDMDAPVWRRNSRQFYLSQAVKILVAPVLLMKLFNFAMVRKPLRGDNNIAGKGRLKLLLRILIVHGLWIALLFQISFFSVICGYVFPLILVNIFASIREYNEHKYLVNGEFCVYDVDCNIVERLIFAGGRFNLHALHHIFPELPQRQLPKLLDKIKKYEAFTKNKYFSGENIIARKKSYIY